MRDVVFDQGRAGTFQFCRQSGIDFGLAERRLPGAFGENGLGCAAGKVTRTNQDDAARQFQSRVHGAGDVTGIHVAGVRDHAGKGTAGHGVARAGAKGFHLAGEFVRCARIEAAGDGGLAEHSVECSRNGTPSARRV